MMQENSFHRLFFKIFKFKWRNPFILASKILFRGRYPRRVLGIWDFGSGRAVIGDAFSFHAVLQVVAIENHLDTIDVCFVNPKPTSGNRYQITDKLQIQNIISVCRVNPRIGSLFVFNDNDQFSHFFKVFKNSYVVFPNPYAPFASVTNLHHLTDFYEKYGNIPNLRSDENDLQWAKRFIDRYCAGRIPVTVAMRRNIRDSEKNAPLHQWRRFFEFAASRYTEYKFIVVGSREEIVSELLNMENVVFVKREADSSLLQDMALIETSIGFLGHNSGISTFPWFLGKPSLLFGTDEKHVHFGHAVKPGGEYNFLAWNQKHYWGNYTCEDIISGFIKYIIKEDRPDGAL